MRRLCILWALFFCFSAYAGDIDDLMIIESKLYPKIVMLDRNIPSVRITIGIVYDKKSFQNAEKLQKYLNVNGVRTRLVYKKNIDNFSADAYIVTFENIGPGFREKLLNKHRLVFSLYPKCIKNTMVSLDIGIKIRPVLNLKLIKKSGVNLNPVIFKVAEIYNEKE